jgi:hypothetical protein
MMTARAFRITTYLVVGVAISTTVLLADDGSSSDFNTTTSNPPLAQFSPMTSHVQDAIGNGAHDRALSRYSSALPVAPTVDRESWSFGCIA